MTEVVGTTTYSKVDLHGLGYAYIILWFFKLPDPN